MQPRLKHLILSLIVRREKKNVENLLLPESTVNYTATKIIHSLPFSYIIQY